MNIFNKPHVAPPELQKSIPFKTDLDIFRDIPEMAEKPRPGTGKQIQKAIVDAATLTARGTAVTIGIPLVVVGCTGVALGSVAMGTACVLGGLVDALGSVAARGMGDAMPVSTLLVGATTVPAGAVQLLSIGVALPGAALLAFGTKDKFEMKDTMGVVTNLGLSCMKRAFSDAFSD